MNLQKAGNIFYCLLRQILAAYNTTDEKFEKLSLSIYLHTHLYMHINIKIKSELNIQGLNIYAKY